MTTRVKVGMVEVQTDDKLSFKQMNKLLSACAGIAVALMPDEPIPPEPGPPLGFAASIERLPDDLAEL